MQADLFQPAAETAILDFEQQLGLQLPEAYRDFLSTTNGADFDNTEIVPVFAIDYKNKGVAVPADWHHGDSDAFCNSGMQASQLLTLFGIGDHPHFQLTKQQPDYIREWLPAEFLPIGIVDAHVHRLCLDLRPDSFGQVAYWYYPSSSPEPDDDQPSTEFVSWVADDFHLFWESLVEMPFDDLELWT
ncbi:SMI1/KNR4 family protein [Aeoliella mucimassa]|nr:SMI1/KNR4 family protein [Aeoliella mucimassa]